MEVFIQGRKLAYRCSIIDEFEFKAGSLSKAYHLKAHNSSLFLLWYKHCINLSSVYTEIESYLRFFSIKVDKRENESISCS